MSQNKSSLIKRSPRYGLALNVEVSCPVTGTYILKSRNLSESGIFLDKGTHPLPEPDTIVTLRVSQGLEGDEAAPVRARVVRVLEDGMALQFIL